MAIAIVPYAEIRAFAEEIGFPFDHRLNLTQGGVGYSAFNGFIRTSVQWIQELEFKKDEHIKIWTSASIVGEVPKAHEYHSRSVMVGTPNTNPFTMEGSVCHPNFVGSIHALYNDYIADYKNGETDKVAVQEYIRVIIGQKAEDTQLGYGLEIPVEKLWNKHYKTDGISRFWLERSEYKPEEVIFEDVEYFYVRELQPEEVSLYFVLDETSGKFVRIRQETTTIHDVEFKSAEAIDLNNFSGEEAEYIAKERGFEDNVDMLKLGRLAS